MSAIPVHRSSLAAAAWLSLTVAAAGFAASPPPPAPATVAASPAATAPQSAAGASAAAAGTPAVTPAAAPGGDAARHAKRTACLKDAKSKKLVGVEKNAFVKSCTAATAPTSTPVSR